MLLSWGIIQRLDSIAIRVPTTPENSLFVPSHAPPPAAVVKGGYSLRKVGSLRRDQACQAEGPTGRW